MRALITQLKPVYKSNKIEAKMCYDLVLIAVNYEQSKCNVRARRS